MYEKASYPCRLMPTNSLRVYNPLLLLLLLLTFIWREFEKCSKSAKSTVTVCSFCHEECFQPPTKHRQ